jgi:hypothetical protein
MRTICSHWELHSDSSKVQDTVCSLNQLLTSPLLDNKTTIISIRCADSKTSWLMLIATYKPAWIFNTHKLKIEEQQHGEHVRIVNFVIMSLKGKVVPLHAIKAYRGSRCADPLILNLGTKWRWAVSFRLQTLFRLGRTCYPFNRAWVGPKASLDDFGEENFLPLPGFEPWTVHPV